VHLVFLRLPTVEMAVERVAARVAQGGHDIPPQVIARRFIKGWRNFEQPYRGLVDTWQVFDNAGDVAVLLEEGERT
jgi:predicted ABC-type ATPase